MRTLLLTTALVALTALSACDNQNDTASTEPAAGDTTLMMAPADTSTTVVTDEATTTTTSDVTTSADGSVTSTTTTTTTPSEPVQGIAVGEPNPSTPAEPDANACGTHDDLVGKNVSEVDQSALSQPVRVYKSGDPVTLDYNANRTNIETDAAGVIVKVSCG